MGRLKEKRREANVGFAVRSYILKKSDELPVPIKERLMTLRFHLKGRRFATLISAYAPTYTCNEDKTILYSQLRTILRKISNSLYWGISMKYFNAMAGTD